jgi:hypothetical protein
MAESLRSGGEVGDEGDDGNRAKATAEATARVAAKTARSG